jgi:hypothetical protein
MKSPVVVAYSIIALIFLVLTFTVNWVFILPAFLIMMLNQKELFEK